MSEIDQLKKDLPGFQFKLDFINFCNSYFEDFENLYNLATFLEIYSPSN